MSEPPRLADPSLARVNTMPPPPATSLIPKPTRKRMSNLLVKGKVLKLYAEPRPQPTWDRVTQPGMVAVLASPPRLQVTVSSSLRVIFAWVFDRLALTGLLKLTKKVSGSSGRVSRRKGRVID